MVTIPKIIHYCWFGNNVKSELILKCIDSWEKYLPNYEIIEWNEFNSQIFKNKFYIDALRKKQYAFVSVENGARSLSLLISIKIFLII